MKVTITYQSGHAYGWAYHATTKLNGEQISSFGATIEDARRHMIERLTMILTQGPMPEPEEVDVPVKPIEEEAELPF